MPSLQALQDFKNSFEGIGNERAVLESQDLPFDEFPIPEVEAELPGAIAEEAAADAAGLDALAQMGLDPSVAAALGIEIGNDEPPDIGQESDVPPDDASPGDTADAATDAAAPDTPPDLPTDGDFDLSALLGSIPGDLPDIPDISDEILTPEAPEAPEEDLSIPNGLLDGLADDVEQSVPDTDDALAADTQDFDLDSLDSFDLGDDADSLDLGGDAGGSLDLGGDAESLDLGGDVDSLDLGGDTESLDLGGDAEGLDLGGDAGSLDLGGDTGGLDLGGDIDRLDLGGDAESLDLGSDTDSLDLGGDADSLDLGGDTESLDLGGDAEGLDLGGDVDSLDLGGDANSLDLGGDADSLDLGGDAESLDLGGDADGIDFGGDVEGIDLGGDAGEGIDLGGDVEGIDLGGDADSLDLGGDAESLDFGGETEDLDLGDDVIDLDPGSPPVADALGGTDDAAGLDLDDFDIPGLEEGASFGGTSDVDEPEVPDADTDLGTGFTEDDLNSSGEGADSFDTFDMEGTDTVPDEDDDSAPGALDDSSADVDLGDFTLPGIDDMLGDSAPGVPGAAPKGKGRRSIFGGPPPEDEEPEEIQLSDADLVQLKRTLAAYPLNLRLAVEECIAEQAVAPDQMATLVRLLVRNAPARETAALAGKILNRTISIPRGFQKKTGEQLEVEQGSFAYIFAHRFLPVLGIALFIGLVAASSFYLVYRFIYTPAHADNIYQLGYDRILNGEYERANQRFTQAFQIHPAKNWFYRYAEAFRDQRQYLYAEEKYDELLRYYPRDKKGVLDYAGLETNYLRNYQKADLLLRRNILEYNPNDQDALLAQGDNALAWGEEDPSKYEDARFAYARLLERYGWTDPVAERMLRYFIRTDNLKEVLPLQSFFMDDPKKKISAETLAELGGYLLDKRTEEVRGVPNAYVEQIEGVRDVLLKAVLEGPNLPEAHYHLSRYYRNLGSDRDEQLTLEVALRTFDSAPEGSIRRLVYHIEALKRDAEILIGGQEFFPAEERLVKAIGLYENGLARRLLSPASQFGQLYASMGDLEYFTKSGDMEMTLKYYLDAERSGYAPPEMLYRMGSAYYHREEWAPALERFFTASSQLPLNRRLLLALGNTTYRRGDFFAAQGYYNRLLDLLETERARLPVLLPNDRPEYLELAERLMIARNNMGVTLEALTERTGNPRYRAQSLGYYTQSAQAWDALTRNPTTMIRMGATGDLSTPGTSPAYLNSRNVLYPQPGYEPQIIPQIDKDVLEPSIWEELVPAP